MNDSLIRIAFANIQQTEGACDFSQVPSFFVGIIQTHKHFNNKYIKIRYDDSVRMILDEIKKILPAVELVGQWSIDVMQNGNDFYIIDMALAENSALNDCVPRNKLRAYPQQWLPMN